jgi:hypothetical protein
MLRSRRARVVLVLTAIVVLGGVGGGIVAVRSGPHLTPAQIAAQQRAAALHRELVTEERAANGAVRLVTAVLPKRSGDPAPTASLPLYADPLPAHHVIGYVPYWEVASIGSADLTTASDLVYSSVCPASDGSIDPGSGGDDCALGLEDLSGSGVATLVANAHAAGDRVLLSVETTDDALIERLDAHRGQTATALAASLVGLERAHGFDGTNIDLEGTNPADREGFVRFVADLTAGLRRDDPTGEIVIDTYADAAAGSASFFDPKRLAPLADALFVMNYSLESSSAASADSPLESPILGYSAVQTLIEYEKIVPPAKIILGLPFYGFDFATKSAKAGSVTTGSGPEAQTYSQITTAARPALWDPGTETPYATFKSGGTWHQLWFDDPVSIALKVALASRFHTAGVGAWAFGMENGDPLMLAALTGGRPPLRTSLARS